jgi:Asp-tRNA(Asn)/Glu-tRNA(Gln) amidotransferase A subunit family amidase
VISVPVGLTRNGLPVGLQIMGRPRSDADVLAAAQLLEQAGPFAAMVPRSVKI